MPSNNLFGRFGKFGRGNFLEERAYYYSILKNIGT